MEKYLKKTFIVLFCTMILGSVQSCKKEDKFLSAIPNNQLSVPNTLDDLNLMIRDEGTFNNSETDLSIASADEYYPTELLWDANDEVSKNVYLWKSGDVFGTQPVSDWNYRYSAVYSSNTILDALANIKIEAGQQNEANNIKGTALFYRAWAFYNLLQIFTMPYDSTKASSELGIPLRLTSDFNSKSTRANEKVCYTQVTNDLKLAISLLPATSSFITLPTKTSASGFLARVYLTMGDYNNALAYSDKFLKSFNTLTDFNNLSPGSYPIANSYLAEDVYHAAIGSIEYSTWYSKRNTIIDSVLYKSYEQNDLRKSVYFWNLGNGPSFIGTFDVLRATWFCGITTGEIYLTRAECYARLGNQDAAMADLNTLLLKRYKTGTFIARIATSSDNALSQILLERRKEMVFRGTRWADLRRLNLDPKFAVTLKRNIEGITATLPPNDIRYALPIPFSEIKLSGIPQNPR